MTPLIQTTPRRPRRQKQNGEALDKTSDEFGTPDWLFKPLHEEFQFTVDAAASAENHKLPTYWTKETDGLAQSWAHERVFCNPPYSRGNVKAFFLKAYEETRLRANPCKIAVLLIPTYTERAWFHEFRNCFECRFIQTRIQFIGGTTGARGNHMLVIFRNKDWAWWSV